MNKLEEKRLSRKNKILTEAKKLILERGINEWLMSEIAKASGISRQRLYVYYSNIDEILYDIMEKICTDSFLDRLTKTTVDDPVAVIKYAILSFPSLSDDAHDDLLFLSLYDVYAATHINSERKVYKAGIFLFEKQIADGQNRGQFRRDQTVAELSSTVTILLTGYLYRLETLSKESRAKMLSEELLTQIADMILSYLQGS